MKKNILIIDDSALMRRVLSDIIGQDERFEVSDTATNGLEALKIMQSKKDEIDAVLLDINMPVMDGIEFLKEFKQLNIDAAVIIVSTIASKNAKETIYALELGAFDFVKKPDNFQEIKSLEFSDRLLEKLDLAVKVQAVRKLQTKSNSRDNTERMKATSNVRHMQNSQGTGKLVVIACSTGGPKALYEVIPKLPGNLDASILIVQHMPAGFTKSLADRLNELSRISVKEAAHGEVITKGTVYIAKGGYQLRLVQNSNGQYQLSVTKEAARHGLAPCADITFESLVDTGFEKIICVVLTGMGSDATAGIIELNKKRNIYVIAQNEETSVVYGMPKVIRDAGLVDEVVAVSDVSEAIVKNVEVI